MRNHLANHEPPLLLLCLFIPSLTFPLDIFDHILGFEDRTALLADAWDPSESPLIAKDRANAIDPLLPSLHDGLGHIANARPGHTRACTDEMTSPTRSTRALLLLALTHSASPLHVGSLDLTVEILKDGGIFLVSHSLLGKICHALLAATIDDSLFFELSL